MTKTRARKSGIVAILLGLATSFGCDSGGPQAIPSNPSGGPAAVAAPAAPNTPGPATIKGTKGAQGAPAPLPPPR